MLIVRNIRLCFLERYHSSSQTYNEVHFAFCCQYESDGAALAMLATTFPM